MKKSVRFWKRQTVKGHVVANVFLSWVIVGCRNSKHFSILVKHSAFRFCQSLWKMGPWQSLEDVISPESKEITLWQLCQRCWMIWTWLWHGLKTTWFPGQQVMTARGRGWDKGRFWRVGNRCIRCSMFVWCAVSLCGRSWLQTIFLNSLQKRILDSLNLWAFQCSNFTKCS